MICHPKNQYLRNDTTVLEIGTELDNGKYKIIDILGKGGFGIVYKVKRINDFKELAIKELLISSGAICMRTHYNNKVSTKNPKIFNIFKEKVKKEVKFFSQNENKNSNIIDIYGFFEENNTVYTVMEYIKGCDLEELVEKNRFYFSEVEILDLLEQLSNGFKKIHKKNIIHRDIKPNNIIRTNSGTYKLIDFTNIKMFLEEERGVITEMAGLNTKIFSPPELISTINNEIGVYSDIYSLGMTIYYCLSGKLDAPDANQRQINDTFKNNIDALDISDKYKSTITKMTHLKKDNRFQSIDEVLEYLEEIPFYKKKWYELSFEFIKDKFNKISFYISKISFPSISLPSISVPSFDFNRLINLLKVIGIVSLLAIIYRFFPSLESKICDTQQKMKVCKERYREIAFSPNPNLSDLDEFEKLVKGGVPINEIKNRSDETALNHLAYKGKYEFVKVLVDNGINPNIKDNKGETGIYEAIEYYPKHRKSSIQMIHLLIKNKADVTVRTKKASPLYFAVKYKLVDIVKELVDSGVCSSEKGRTYGKIDIYGVANSVNIAPHKKKIKEIKKLLKDNGCY